MMTSRRCNKITVEQACLKSTKLVKKGRRQSIEMVGSSLMAGPSHRDSRPVGHMKSFISRFGIAMEIYGHTPRDLRR